MALPLNWVERIFAKLTIAYGRDFLARWEGINICDVKTDWAHELSGYENNPEAIAYTLANLPNKPPTVYEFRQISRNAPSKDIQMLPAPPADPERVRKELEKLAPMREAFAEKKQDGKEWARRLQARHLAGEKLKPIQIQFYKEALAASL